MGAKPGNTNGFKKGQSGNPKGPPRKEWSLSNAMREYLDEPDPIVKLSRRDVFIESQYLHAIKGDPTAAKHIWNYLDGMPKGHGGEPPAGTTYNTQINFNLKGLNDEQLEALAAGRIRIESLSPLGIEQPSAAD